MRRVARRVVFGLAVAWSLQLLPACGSEFVSSTTTGGSAGAGGNGGAGAGSANGGKGGKGQGGSSMNAGTAGQAPVSGAGGTESNPGVAGASGSTTGGKGGAGGEAPLPIGGAGGSDGHEECEVELLTNGSFDAVSAGWDQVAQPERVLIHHQSSDILNDLGHTPVSPEYAVLLGQADFDDSSLSQQVTVPAGANLLVTTFYLHIHSDEGGGQIYDSLTLSLASAASEPLPFATYTNNDINDDWEAISVQLDATPYRGKSVSFVLSSVSDEDVDTIFLLDSFSLIAKVCDP